MVMPPSYNDHARQIELHCSDPEDCTVTFGDSGTLTCSSTLLALMSPYFEAALQHGFKESGTMKVNLPDVDQNTFMGLAHLARGLPLVVADDNNLLLLWEKADRLSMSEVSSALATALAKSVTVDTCIGWLRFFKQHRMLHQVASRARQVALANIERVAGDLDVDILLLLVQDDQLAVQSEDVVLQIVSGVQNTNWRNMLLQHVRGGLLSAAALQFLAPEQLGLVLACNKAYNMRKGLDIQWRLFAGGQGEVVTTTNKVTALFASEAGKFAGYVDCSLQLWDPNGNHVWHVSLKKRKDRPIFAIFASGDLVVCNVEGSLRVITTRGELYDVEIPIGLETKTIQWKNLAVWNKHILHAHYDHPIHAYGDGQQPVWSLECKCPGMQVWGDTVYFI